MAEKKQEPSFTVTDRRLFTSDGELRGDVPEEKELPKPVESAKAQASAPPPVEAAKDDGLGEIPTPPSTEEQQAQVEAYKKSAKELDSQVELSGHSAKDFEVTFERFLAQLYMTAMLQLGLMRQQGEQPHIDIIGARGTIDTLSLIGEKTKGNLTPQEENFLQNSLYELRMAYVEVTNALARAPQAPPATGTGGPRAR